jgi:hypothetical protein
VTVNGDVTPEADETFTVDLTNPVNATISDPQGLGTITNDDGGTPTFTITNVVTHPEGNAGTTAFTFTVTLAPAAAGPTSVQAATSDASATVADNDYTALTQTLNFATGATTQTFTVLVNGDTKFEPTESFGVTLSNNSPGTALGGAFVGTGTITAEDLMPSITISDVSLAEGNAGTTAFIFNVTLSNPSATPISVDFTTADGTATVAGLDYAANGGTMNFAPGITLQTVTVLVNGDTAGEAHETFFVNLTNGVNATITDAQGIGTITNDDAGGAGGADIPALGPRELLLLAALLAAVAVVVMRRG